MPGTTRRSPDCSAIGALECTWRSPSSLPVRSYRGCGGRSRGRSRSVRRPGLSITSWLDLGELVRDRVVGRECDLARPGYEVQTFSDPLVALFWGFVGMSHHADDVKPSARVVSHGGQCRACVRVLVAIVGRRHCIVGCRLAGRGEGVRCRTCRHTRCSTDGVVPSPHSGQGRQGSDRRARTGRGTRPGVGRLGRRGPRVRLPLAKRPSPDDCRDSHHPVTG